MIPPSPPPLPQGFREVALVHSEWAPRRQGACPAVTLSSHWTSFPRSPIMQRHREKGDFYACKETFLRMFLGYFVWKSSKIICSNVWIGHRNPILCIYWGILWVVILRNTENFGSKPNMPQGNGNSTAPFWHERSSCCLSTKPGEIGCWVFCIWKHWPKFKEVWYSLPSLPCFYLKMLRFVNHWVKAWNTAPSVPEDKSLSPQGETQSQGRPRTKTVDTENRAAGCSWSLGCRIHWTLLYLMKSLKTFGKMAISDPPWSLSKASKQLPSKQGGDIWIRPSTKWKMWGLWFKKLLHYKPFPLKILYCISNIMVWLWYRSNSYIW